MWLTVVWYIGYRVVVVWSSVVSVRYQCACETQWFLARRTIPRSLNSRKESMGFQNVNRFAHLMPCARNISRHSSVQFSSVVCVVLSILSILLRALNDHQPCSRTSLIPKTQISPPVVASECRVYKNDRPGGFLLGEG